MIFGIFFYLVVKSFMSPFLSLHYFIMKPGRPKHHYIMHNNFLIGVYDSSDDEDVFFKKRRNTGIIVPRSQPSTEDEYTSDNEDIFKEQHKPSLVDEFTQTIFVPSLTHSNAVIFDEFVPTLRQSNAVLIPPQAWILTVQVPDDQREYLKKFQIFEDINEATECSFIYALRQSGIPELKLTEMKTHLKSQNPQELFDLCKQANINVALRKYKKKPDGSISSISVKLEFQKNGMKYIYLGSPAVTASFIVGLILIDNHYMIRPTDTNAIQKIIIMINSGKIIPYN